MELTLGRFCAAVAAVGLMGLPGFGAPEAVCVVGGHPDDLVGSAGLCCLLDDAGFKLHVIDFTRGELGLGLPGLKDGTTGRRRVEEEKAACRIIHAEPHFIDEVDGSAYASSNAVAQLAALFGRIKPRAVILHWPVDVHMDHVMSTAASLKALQLAKQDPEIYFFEETEQSMGFEPDVYVDITSVIDRRAAVIRAYKCQNEPPWDPEPDWILKRKQADAKFRGSRMSPSVAYAEAFATYGGRAPRARTIFTDLAATKKEKK